MTRLFTNLLFIPCLRHFTNQKHFSICFNSELRATTYNQIRNMAPREMKRVGLEPTMEKNTGARFQAKRMKAEMGKTIDKQRRIRKKQRRIRVRFGEVERQCDRLKEEIKMIMTQTARTKMKIVLMFKILKARQNGDSFQATMLTQFLREIVAVERANATLDEVKDDDP